MCAVLMTHCDVDDASVLPELLVQIPPEAKIEAVGGDGTYDTKAARAAIAGRGALALIPPAQDAMHWPASQAGAQERNEAIEHMARRGKQDWKEQSGYHRRSLVENLMYRFKTLTGDKLWALNVKVQDAELAVRVGIINRCWCLHARNPSRSPKTRGKGKPHPHRRFMQQRRALERIDWNFHDLASGGAIIRRECRAL